MRMIKGYVVQGDYQTQGVMFEFGAAFRAATGEYLYPGTLNVQTLLALPIKEHFRIRACNSGIPDQDLLFEICRINRMWGYRMVRLDVKKRKLVRKNGLFEIICAQKIPNIYPGCDVVIELLRDDLPPRKWEKFQNPTPLDVLKRIERVERSNRLRILQAEQEEQ